MNLALTKVSDCKDSSGRGPTASKATPAASREVCIDGSIASLGSERAYQRCVGGKLFKITGRTRWADRKIAQQSPMSSLVDRGQLPGPGLIYEKGPCRCRCL